MNNKEEVRSAMTESAAGPPTLGSAGAEAFQAALKRLLDSEAFSGSRRMSAFLQFAGQAALEGRTEVDQYEVAERVLKRHEDFNPLDDASVRKLASQVRSKLEEYFEGEGAGETVVVSLPRRSYVLRFRQRQVEPRAVEGAVEQPAKERLEEVKSAPEAQRERGWWALALAVAVGLGLLAAGIGLGWLAAPRSAAVERGEAGATVIRTQRGDLRGAPVDVAADAVQVGPAFERGDDAVVELSFVPESATQQAGVMALGSPDHFVRFGQHFKDRAMLEQSYEVDAVPSQMRTHFLADPRGQMGIPRWLSLRRTGEQYAAFQSADGFEWTAFAPPVELKEMPEEQRAAFYAYNGRSDGPSAAARFRGFRVGPSFHNRADGPLRAEEFPGWTERADCVESTTTGISGGALEVGFASSGVGCNWYFTRPAPEGDWSYAALVDMRPVSGNAAGLVLQGGGRGNIHLSRRHLQTSILTVERTHDEDQRINDFPGAPPVVLRLDMRGGVLTAWASRDGRRFVPVGDGAPIQGRASDLRIGIYSMIAHWTSEGPRPPARFYWIQRLVETPTPLQRAGTR